MPTEDELRDALRGTSAPNRLDVSKVVRRTRARRLPQQLAAGGAGVAAIAAISIFGIQTSQFTQGSGGTAGSAPTVAEDSQLADGDAETFATKRLPADRINLCGAPVAAAEPGASGLQLDVVSPATAPVGTAPLSATVRLTNTGTERVTGTTLFAPALTLSQNGVTVWHTNGAYDTSAVLVDLEPGASLEYVTVFTPVQCEPQDDELEQFRPDLPAVPAGAYELSAVIDFDSDAPTPTTELELVMGPRSALLLE